MISAANLRSIRVAERLGFEPVRKDMLFEDPVVVYAIQRT
jgi:RimJ/RimL family protein N-acetyltransferase